LLADLLVTTPRIEELEELEQLKVVGGPVAEGNYLSQHPSRKRTTWGRPISVPNLGLEHGWHVRHCKSRGFYPTSVAHMTALASVLRPLTYNRTVCDPACGPTRRVSDLLPGRVPLAIGENSRACRLKIASSQFIYFIYKISVFFIVKCFYASMDLSSSFFSKHEARTIEPWLARNGKRTEDI
jgi:hypothetical protein